MRTLRIPVAMAACFVGLFGASNSVAQSATTPPRATAPQPPQPPQPQQPQQPPVIVVQPPAQPQTQTQPQAQPQRQAQQPTGTARTTQAQYRPSTTGRYSEKTIVRWPHETLLSTGMGLFIMSYGPSVVAGAMSDRSEDKRLFVPVAGPWLNLAHRDCRANPCGETEDVARAMILTSGVVQGAGALMTLGSLLIPERTTISERPRGASAKPEVKVVPVSFGTGAGIGAVGRF
jgi:hypothetical protein